MREENEKFFYIFENCRITKGFKRSIITDLSRKEVFIIPNSYIDLIKEFRKSTVKGVLSKISQESHHHIEVFFEYFIENELGCFVDDIERFPEMTEQWDSPLEIENSIIDIDNRAHDFEKIFQNLEELKCRYIQIRIYNELNIEFIRNILDKSLHKDFWSIEVMVKYNPSIKNEEIVKLVDDYPMISDFIVHSSPENLMLATENGKDFGLGKIFFITQTITSCQSCGIINFKSFIIPELQDYFSYKLRNSCLNQKISIDVNGEIKNCPSMTKSYGNINDTTLKEALYKEGFKDLWHINKDQIKVCQDCEFRHICSDCRAYLQDPSDIYSKPAKCSYDPYTATWAEENITENSLYGK